MGDTIGRVVEDTIGRVEAGRIGRVVEDTIDRVVEDTTDTIGEDTTDTIGEGKQVWEGRRGLAGDTPGALFLNHTLQPYSLSSAVAY